MRVELAWIGVIAVAWAGVYHRLTSGAQTAGRAAGSGPNAGGETPMLARRERPALLRFLQSPALLVLLLQSFAFREMCTPFAAHSIFSPPL